MKRSIIKLIPVAALLIGIALLLYPSISEYINSIHQSKAIANYNKISTSLKDEEVERFFEEAREYNERLASTEDTIFYPEKVSGYYDTLDITGTGIMGYLTIDKIDLELPIYHSVNENVLQIAVGHLPGTSLPVGGEGTHTVLSGHRGLVTARLFTDLDKMEIGDTFVISVLSEFFTYQVDQIKTVKPYEIDDLRITPGMDYCTLFTCTPYGINSHRLLVRAHRIENAEDIPKIFVVNEAFRISPVIVTPVVAAPMLMILFVWMLISVHRQKKANKNKKDNAQDKRSFV